MSKFLFGISSALLLMAFIDAMPLSSRISVHFPELNITLVDICYYNRTEWMRDQASWCHIITINSLRQSMPSGPFRPLQDAYQDYVSNEKYDRQVALDCFMRHRYNFSKAVKCTKIIVAPFKKLTEDYFTRREINALKYVDMLTHSWAEIDRCLDVEERMLPFPEECEFLDDLELIEHCFLYHQFTRYEPCRGISWPRIALLNDTRTLYRYSAYKNVSTEFDEQHIEELRMGMEGIPDPMAKVLECLHYNSWLDNLEDRCYNITQPKEGIAYGSEDRRLQDLFAHVEKQNRIRDCDTHHSNEKFLPCYKITWK